MSTGLQTLIVLVILLALGAVATALVFRTWRHHARPARGAPGQALPVSGAKTPLDRLLDPPEAAHPGQTGLGGLWEDTDALAARVHSARMARRSLDLMYYIWSSDMTGALLLREVLAAADRGVRVRLLLDDANVQGYDLDFLALNQHPLIEVRLFNPIRNRGHVLRRWFELILGLSRFNRRLHCKAWVADGRVAILGGRNIGDTYFGAAPIGRNGAQERCSRDADILVAGPLVAEIASVFDSYWNLGLVLPILSLWPNFRIRRDRLGRHLVQQAGSAEARAFLARCLRRRKAGDLLATSLRWTLQARLLADPPGKAYGQRDRPGMAESVEAVLGEAKSEVRLVTPYFVPGAAGLSILLGLLRRGVAVSLLTNALSASDNVFVHGAYRRYRSPLLQAGAQVFEFAPPAAKRRQRDVLHAKIFIIDRKAAIVGSLNFDLRSAHTNTEIGILFEEPTLLAELIGFFDTETAARNAYALGWTADRVAWSVDRPALPARMFAEPEVSVAWRALSWVVGRLPIHSWL